jgi:hypothetical protein
MLNGGTMLKITQLEPPAPQPNPSLFSFDPDTQPGEWVLPNGCERPQLLISYQGGIHTNCGKHAWHNCKNIHRLPDGRWVLGRDPALVKAKEPPTYNMTQAASKAVPGDVFRTVNAFRGQTEFFVCVGEGWVTRDNGLDVWFTVENIDACGERDLHYLGNHTLELKVGGPVKHPSEGKQ